MARRILLADDSVTAQNMGRRILHDAGYEVITVNNGSAALKKIAEHKPDLVILDVYMPGYGGLEVCSRLKETRETARIPVLLTVGKLEPFKPEEARRVKADAYIVKPFEASELLTALTKLEDKIVPGPEPYKQGRFAKAMAAVEHGGAENEFGDQESGWKDRLIMPGGKKKAAEVEPEAVPAKEFRSVAREEGFRPVETKREFERPMPAGLPQDISPEEIAAITAAVAKINGKSEEAAATPEPETKAWPIAEAAVTPTSEAVTEEIPVATFASATEQEEAPAEKSEFPVQAAPSDIEPTMESMPEPVASAAAEVVLEAASTIEAAKIETESDKPAEEEKRPVSDAEVLAALASLTPAGGDFALASATQQDSVGASFSGPRWIAEAVAVGEEESTFLLEHEMEKAYAAFAAAGAGRASLALATPVEAVMPANDNGHGTAEGASENATVTEPETKPEETVAAPEPSPEPVVEAVATETVTPAPEEAAYAAAASAGTATAESSTEGQPVASAASSEIPAGAPEEGSRVREAELAAAWANWRQIRESIIGDQPSLTPEAEQVADAEAGFKDMLAEAVAEPVAAAEEVAQAEAIAETAPVVEEKHEEEIAAAPVEEAKAEAPETASAEQDPAAIASIVDNMLAELKPKLMEELKRKLGK